MHQLFDNGMGRDGKVARFDWGISVAGPALR